MYYKELHRREDAGAIDRRGVARRWRRRDWRWWRHTVRAPLRKGAWATEGVSCWAEGSRRELTQDDVMRFALEWTNEWTNFGHWGGSLWSTWRHSPKTRACKRETSKTSLQSRAGGLFNPCIPHYTFGMREPFHKPCCGWYPSCVRLAIESLAQMVGFWEADFCDAWNQMSKLRFPLRMKCNLWSWSHRAKSKLGLAPHITGVYSFVHMYVACCMLHVLGFSLLHRDPRSFFEPLPCVGNLQAQQRRYPQRAQRPCRTHNYGHHVSQTFDNDAASTIIGSVVLLGAHAVLCNVIDWLIDPFIHSCSSR